MATLNIFMSFLALTVRFMTKRFIGEYDSSSGEYDAIISRDLRLPGLQCEESELFDRAVLAR